MRRGGAILSNVLKKLAEAAKPDVVTLELDKLAEKLILQAGAKPAFKDYQPRGAIKPFPFTLCVSLNETIVHGLPSNYKLKTGDLLKLDIGLLYESFYVDSAITVLVNHNGQGIVDYELKQSLIDVTREALKKGIGAARAGNTLGDIGHAIQSYVEKNGFAVIRELVGHGIGKNLHEAPNVLNYGFPTRGAKLREGMTLAIEPMVSAGKTGEVILREDDSYETQDGSLAAQFEHTVAITKNNAIILTE